MSQNLDGTFTNVDKVLLVDGYSATGKKLLCMILQTLSRVEKMEMNNFISELSCLRYMDKITLDGYISALKVHLNVTLTNNILSRSMNFRPFDGSSVFNSYKKFEYVKRLFSKDGNYVNEYIRLKKPILHLMTHYCYPSINDLNLALGDKIFFVSMVRHPVYCMSHIKYLLTNIKKSNERFNYIGFKKNNSFVPWYMDVPISDQDSITDHAIKYFIKFHDIEKKIDNENISNINFLKIPFEHFIMNTNYYIEKIVKNLKSSTTKNTKRIMIKERLPSKFFSKRTEQRTFYRHFVNRDKEETQTIYNLRLKEIRDQSSKKNFDSFLEILLNYEKSHSIDYFSTNKYIK